MENDYWMNEKASKCIFQTTGNQEKNLYNSDSKYSAKKQNEIMKSYTNYLSFDFTATSNNNLIAIFDQDLLITVNRYEELSMFSIKTRKLKCNLGKCGFEKMAYISSQLKNYNNYDCSTRALFFHLNINKNVLLIVDY